ncbi:DUF934 domain-containing protein [Saccharospirillum mangrovi]|uniref:DUF934 domain-containing protein n=1 Tax=Saccharospirillum mangrovi TaxID=2161747 RepID=UPI0013001A60|nr:DUF934 domain-containing protein [Saccharospirillum mangrovi]
MQNLIKNGALQPDDAWVLIVDEATTAPTDAPAIWPLQQYLVQRQSGQLSGQPHGVWLNEEQMVDELAEVLDELALVALHFPKFADGRSFSKARLLRERLSFTGEIRAVGDFLPDQVDYLARCGVDAFACRNEQEANTALSMLDTFSVHYQSDTHQTPLFQQR